MKIKCLSAQNPLNIRLSPQMNGERQLFSVEPESPQEKQVLVKCKRQSRWFTKRSEF